MKTQNWIIIIVAILLLSGVGIYQLDKWHDDRHVSNAEIALENNKQNVQIIDSALYWSQRLTSSDIKSKLLVVLKGKYVLTTQGMKDSLELIRVKDSVRLDSINNVPIDSVVVVPDPVITYNIYPHKNVANPTEGSGTVGFISENGGKLSITGRSTEGGQGIEIDGSATVRSGASTTIDLDIDSKHTISVDVQKNVNKMVSVIIGAQAFSVTTVNTFETIESEIPKGSSSVKISFIFTEPSGGGQEITVDNIKINSIK